jgi:ABC-2 type transport system permease protein
MRTIIFIIEKEFTQLFRNKVMVRIIFIMPIIQLFILAYAATFEINSIRLKIVDLDRSITSSEIISHFKGSPFYNNEEYLESYQLAEREIIMGQADQVIIFPADFEKDLQTEHIANVQVVTNAIDGSAASLMNAYSLAIIRDFNENILINSTGLDINEPIDIQYSYWYNPEMNYLNFMVPGILVLLVTLIGMLLSGMNLVREKEIGTIEQINVTPIRKYQFITGKLLPFWVVALFELAFGLTIAKLVFDIPIVGSIGLIFFCASIYLLVVQGMGLLISTMTNTQQQAMFLAWFIMVIFIMMSGLFTPIESMPEWAQVLTWFNPIAYFIEMMRMMMLKGSQIQDIMQSLILLSIMGVLVLSAAVWRYRKIS